MTAAWLIVHLDLAEGMAQVPAAAQPTYVVFWWRSLPLGARAFLPAELPLTPDQIASLGAGMIADQVAARRRGAPPAVYDGQADLSLSVASAVACDPLQELEAAASAPLGNASSVSVVVCTRDRPDALAACLKSLTRMTPAAGELIVVDNSADGSALAVARNCPEVVYIHEPRPGLSAARNAGVAASRGEIVAFTDDDVEVTENWAANLAQAFQSSEVDAVTGLVLPARLDTPAQRFFQFDLGGFGDQYAPVTFGEAFFRRTRPTGVPVWRIGAGANMAFRRSSLVRAGPFDERLGAGAAGCSEDSEIWYRLLASGGLCLYEPRCVVTHHHRADWPGLKRQVRAYMEGHVAALFVQAGAWRDRGSLRRVVKQLPAHFLRTAFRALKDGSPERLTILRLEVEGWLRGLRYAAYLFARPPSAADGAAAPPARQEVRHA